jgi:beta-glucosidase
MFRDDFVWGVASSAYQIEGRDANDGAGAMIWDKFIAEGGTKDGYGAEVACDHMHRYKEDFALMRLMGIKAYRFSISWARLIPEGTGKVNEKAVALYRDMILEMKKNGIEPYLTMYHWEFPQALQDRGGWLNEEVIQWFGEYAKVVAENFSDICENFITLNEPECFVGIGHMSGWHAPGLHLPYKDVFQIAHNALRAHGQAVINLRKYACRPIKVGYAPTCGMAYPVSNRPEDVEAARKVLFGFYQPMDNWTWNVAWFNDPVFLGKYPEEGLEKFAEYLPEITDEDMKLISQPLDFMGQNIYNGYFVKAGENGEIEFPERPEGFPKTAANWPVTPDCFYWGVKFIYDRYKLPLFVTENGMSCHDDVSLDGRVHDPNRQNFLDMYISALQKANDEGVDVRGYFLWTFLDNFEWDKGYTERFGIVHVDFATQKRIVKDSAFWYQKVIETNGAVLSINTKQRPILFLEPVFKK